MRIRLSTLWIFAVLNCIYSDVFIIFDTLSNSGTMKDLMSGNSGPVSMTRGAYYGPSFPFPPLPGRSLGKHRRRIHAAAALRFFLIGRLPTAFTYYTLFVIFEVISTVLIIWSAWKWRESKSLATVAN
jgi:hypothetical protein